MVYSRSTKNLHKIAYYYIYVDKNPLSISEYKIYTTNLSTSTPINLNNQVTDNICLGINFIYSDKHIQNPTKLVHALKSTVVYEKTSNTQRHGKTIHKHLD